MIDEANNIAGATDDEWSVIGHVSSLNVSLHRDYHDCMACEVCCHSEQNKLNVWSQEENSCTSQSYYVFQNNKSEFVWKHKDIAVKENQS